MYKTERVGAGWPAGLWLVGQLLVVGLLGLGAEVMGEVWVDPTVGVEGGEGLAEDFDEGDL